MEASHHERKRLGAYYTPPELVARALDRLPAAPHADAPYRVVDLACGAGVWLEAAARRFTEAELIGVDVDARAIRAARAVLGRRARLRAESGLLAGVGEADLVLGNPPWGAGRTGPVRRGEESASRFVARALEVLRPGGRVCLLVPVAWLEVAAHRPARADLLARAAVERIEPLGNVFRGVFCPAALLIARRELDPARRLGERVWTPRGERLQAELARDPELKLHPPLAACDRALLERLERRAERLSGRVSFILGVVTGANRRALGSGEAHGEPIVCGSDVTPFRLRPPSRRLTMPLAEVQQAAARGAYAREKVVYRFIADRPIAAVDGAGYLTLNSANALACDDPALAPEFVAAALNSSPLAFAHRARSSLPRLLRRHLERLPLPAAGPGERRAVVALARAAATGDAEAAPALDELIMELFGLSRAERLHVTRTVRRADCEELWPPS